MMCGGIDIGTTLTKYVVLDTARVAEPAIQAAGPTPSTAEGIHSLVRSIIERCSVPAVVWSIACFRRAAMVRTRDGMVRLSFAREASRLQPGSGPSDRLCSSRTSISNRFATVHRWVAESDTALHAPLDTLESWLSECFTGRRLISECAAWLSGLWDPDRRDWDSECLHRVGVARSRLPDVAFKGRKVGSIVWPVLGDHQATTLVACTFSRAIAFVEVGTALAVVVGRLAEGLEASQVPLRPPQSAGYDEYIDPYCGLRVRGGDSSGTVLPAWTRERWAGHEAGVAVEPLPVMSPDAVCHMIADAVSRVQAPPPNGLLASGGLADDAVCQRMADTCGIQVTRRRALSPAVGAALFAAAATGGRPSLDCHGDAFTPDTGAEARVAAEERWAQAVQALGSA